LIAGQGAPIRFAFALLGLALPDGRMVRRAASPSTLVAARELGRDFLGIELDRTHHRTALLRLQHLADAAA
jgi:hypothetical protein